MTLDDTPYIGRRYCPGCDPSDDPGLEILETSWCGDHKPGDDGSADKWAALHLAEERVAAGPEGDGETGRRYAEFLRRRPDRAGYDGR